MCNEQFCRTLISEPHSVFFFVFVFGFVFMFVIVFVFVFVYYKQTTHPVTHTAIVPSAHSGGIGTRPVVGRNCDYWILIEYHCIIGYHWILSNYQILSYKISSWNWHSPSCRSQLWFCDFILLFEKGFLISDTLRLSDDQISALVYYMHMASPLAMGATLGEGSNIRGCTRTRWGSHHSALLLNPQLSDNAAKDIEVLACKYVTFEIV